jgi:His-Xaa-Ser system protein HxsD
MAGKILLSKECFDREPVVAAAARFTDRYYVSIRPAGEDGFEVSLQAKKADEADENILHIFRNEVIDQQVRHDLHTRFGKLRDMIVEQAFYPLEKK